MPAVVSCVEGGQADPGLNDTWGREPFEVSFSRVVFFDFGFE